MKTKNALPLLAIIAVGLCFTSCKKTDSNTTETPAAEIATTTDLAGRAAVSDNLTEDANDVFMNAASEKLVLGGRGVAGRPLTPQDPCGTVTISPVIGFPKTIVIDFGAGCTSLRGVTRSGKITVVIDTFVRVPGSTAVMTFTNYVVNGFKIEGTITWTNTSTVSVRSWKREVVGGKTTNTIEGKFWYHSGIKNVVQVEGLSTPLDLSDDVFSITGTHTVTNMNNKTRTCTIDVNNPLIKENSCLFISKGSMKVQGPNHYAIIDFGDGTCDDQATIAIDGGTQIAFTLH